MDKVELKILALTETSQHSNNFTVVLGEVGGNRRLPVVIGIHEAQAIAIQLENVKTNRPFTHDLFKSMAEQFAIRITQVVISGLVEGVFHTTIYCSDQFQSHEIDSRTSDAIVLAMKFNSPIYIYESILAEAGIEVNDDNFPKSDFPSTTHKNEETSPLKSIEELELDLNEALKNENYELAARLRDEITKRKK